MLASTPSLTTTMARSSVLDAWIGFGAALRSGSIRAGDGERIAFGVAEANGCGSCLAAHSSWARTSRISTSPGSHSPAASSPDVDFRAVELRQRAGVN